MSDVTLLETGLIRASECRTLGDLIVTAYNSIPGCMPDPEYDVELREVAIRRTQVPVIVARDRNRLLGGLTYVPGPGPFAELAGDGDAEIRMFAVAPHLQGKGVGRALMTTAIDRAQQERRQRIVLSTSPWMTAARSLYERLGFCRTPSSDWSVISSGLRFDLLAYELVLSS